MGSLNCIIICYPHVMDATFEDKQTSLIPFLNILFIQLKGIFHNYITIIPYSLSFYFSTKFLDVEYHYCISL